MNGNQTSNGSPGRAARRFCIAIMASVVLAAAPVEAPAAGPFMNWARPAPPPSGARGLCQSYRWACVAEVSASRPIAGEMKVVTDVNRSVNRRFRQVSDTRQYRREEHWALPTSRGGDCEDFALFKKLELMRRGIEPSRLLIATALDRQRRSHAVLIYRSARGDVVLDNQTDRIRGWRETGYVFLRMQDPRDPRRWVSGFRGG